VGKPQREVEPFRDELLTFRKALGRRVRELRNVRGWSQEDFASRAHVHRTFAGSLERGEKNCSFHALVMIARCFGITMSELLRGVEAAEPAQSVPDASQTKHRKSRAGRGDIDPQRVLEELTALERSVQNLKRLTQGAIVGRGKNERGQ